MKIVAIIPARGGSKGVARKNLQDLGGKPLILHTIEQALAAERVNGVWVTTDCADIAAVSAEAGVSIIERPGPLADDEASSESAILHALSEINQTTDVDLVVFLQCTAPFRRRDDIDRAIQHFQNEQADSLLSVVPSHRFIWQISEGNAESINYDYRNRPRRQNMPAQFEENGSIYLFRPTILCSEKNRLGGRVALFEMHPQSQLDIDTEYDLELANILWNHYR